MRNPRTHNACETKRHLIFVKSQSNSNKKKYIFLHPQPPSHGLPKMLRILSGPFSTTSIISGQPGKVCLVQLKRDYVRNTTTSATCFLKIPRSGWQMAGVVYLIKRANKKSAGVFTPVWTHITVNQSAPSPPLGMTIVRMVVNSHENRSMCCTVQSFHGMSWLENIPVFMAW